MRELTIAGRRVADNMPAYVVAEVGHNHQGDLAKARELVTKAATAGVHAIKFQKRHNATLFSRELLDAPYDHEHSFGRTYGEHRQALELSRGDYVALMAQAAVQGIACFATAFDIPSANLLATLNVPAYKLASGSLTDRPLLEHVSTLGRPVILSTGGGTMADIDRAMNVITKHTTQLALLHCTAAYPAEWAELNLRCIQTLRDEYPNFVIGWSGHDSGIGMALVAYTLGARIIEKHFTLNRAMKGTDHAFSLEPVGLTKLCRDLLRAHVALGDGVKRYYDSERRPIAKMRRRETPNGWRITGELDELQ